MDPESTKNSLYAKIAFTAVAAVAVLVVFKKVFMKAPAVSKRKPGTALDPDNFLAFPLKEKIEVSHDTRIFRFNLQTPDTTLGLPIGQHLTLKADVDGNVIQRMYTPISSDDDKGHVDIMVKVYFKNVHPKFPEGGKMTQHLENLKVGECIHIKGPSGKFDYSGNGQFSVKKISIVNGAKQTQLIKHNVKKFAMIAGGSGITPMLQIIRHVLKHKEDPTECHLIFANQTEDDILLRAELEECAKDPRMKLWYTVDRPPESGWKYSSGFVSEEMIRNHLPTPGPDCMAVLCGPPPMINFACKPNLEKVGWDWAKQVVCY